MRIALTGHRGWIGSNLKASLEKDYEVLTYEEDIRDFDNVKYFSDKFNENDIMVHFAGRNKGENQDILDTNVVGTYNCLYFFPGKVIVAGSTYDGFNHYRISKDVCEALTTYDPYAGHIYYAMPKVIGPKCKPNYNSFISTLCYNFAKGIEFKSLIKGDLNVNMQFIHIDTIIKDIKDIIRENSDFSARKFPSNIFYFSFQNILDIFDGKKITHEYADYIEKIIKEIVESYKHE